MVTLGFLVLLFAITVQYFVSAPILGGFFTVAADLVETLPLPEDAIETYEFLANMQSLYWMWIGAILAFILVVWWILSMTKKDSETYYTGGYR